MGSRKPSRFPCSLHPPPKPEPDPEHLLKATPISVARGPATAPDLTASFPRETKEEKKDDCIYVMPLRNDCWYIGHTKNEARRLRDHATATFPCEWLRIHPPLVPVRSIDTRVRTGPTHEDAVTLEYMQKYGISKVRGGSFTDAVLPPDQQSTLEKMMRTAGGQCFACGKVGHFAAACTTVTATEEESAVRRASQTAEDGKRMFCTRCRRSSHWASHCFAKTDVSGRPL
jgi:predicted GIY-YIG superfamily endonuclease